MILDVLSDAARYESFHPAFAAAFRFLREQPLSTLPCGRHEIDGDKLFCLLADEDGRTQAGARLEAHQRYIDIQYVVTGAELIGWMPTNNCTADSPYDPERDIGFYRDQPEMWITLPVESFAVFFPEDAHAPLAGTGPVRKAVIKVAVEC